MSEEKTVTFVNDEARKALIVKLEDSRKIMMILADSAEYLTADDIKILRNTAESLTTITVAQLGATKVGTESALYEREGYTTSAFVAFHPVSDNRLSDNLFTLKNVYKLQLGEWSLNS